MNPAHPVDDVVGAGQLPPEPVEPPPPEALNAFLWRSVCDECGIQPQSSSSACTSQHITNNGLAVPPIVGIPQQENHTQAGRVSPRAAQPRSATTLASSTCVARSHPVKAVFSLASTAEILRRTPHNNNTHKHEVQPAAAWERTLPRDVATRSSSSAQPEVEVHVDDDDVGAPKALAQRSATSAVKALSARPISDRLLQLSAPRVAATQEQQQQHDGAAPPRPTTSAGLGPTTVAESTSTARKRATTTSAAAPRIARPEVVEKKKRAPVRVRAPPPPPPPTTTTATTTTLSSDAAAAHAAVRTSKMEKVRAATAPRRPSKSSVEHSTTQEQQQQQQQRAKSAQRPRPPSSTDDKPQGFYAYEVVGRRKRQQLMEEQRAREEEARRALTFKPSISERARSCRNTANNNNNNSDVAHTSPTTTTSCAQSPSEQRPFVEIAMEWEAQRRSKLAQAMLEKELDEDSAVHRRYRNAMSERILCQKQARTLREAGVAQTEVEAAMLANDFLARQQRQRTAQDAARRALEARYTPTFKPRIRRYVPEKNEEEDDDDEGVRAADAAPPPPEVDATTAPSPATTQVKRSETEVAQYVENMRQRECERKRRLELRREAKAEAEREASRPERFGSTAERDVLAARARDRQRMHVDATNNTMPAKACAGRPSSSSSATVVVRTAPTRSADFFVRERQTLERKQRKIDALRAEMEEHERRACTFTPQIADGSERLVHRRHADAAVVRYGSESPRGFVMDGDDDVDDDGGANERSPPMDAALYGAVYGLLEVSPYPRTTTSRSMDDATRNVATTSCVRPLTYTSQHEAQRAHSERLRPSPQKHRKETGEEMMASNLLRPDPRHTRRAEMANTSADDSFQSELERLQSVLHQWEEIEANCHQIH